MTLLIVAPLGIDTAAHEYQLSLFQKCGFVLWDNRWYDGRFSWPTYSIAYYPLAAVFGIKVLAVMSLAFGAGAMSVIESLTLGAGTDEGANIQRCSGWPKWNIASKVGAFCWGAFVLSAAYPFALGAAFAGWAIVFAVLRATTGPKWRRRLLGLSFFVLSAATLAASALAFLGLGLVIGAMAMGSGLNKFKALIWPLVLLVPLYLMEVVILVVFPDYGRYPFWWTDLLECLGFSALILLLARGVRHARIWKMGALLYAVLALGAFMIPSDLGANVARLRYGALFLALMVARTRRWQPLSLVVPFAFLASMWNLSPLVGAWSSLYGSVDQHSEYWAPALSYVKSHLSPSYRVEAVDTVDHWPAAYFAQGGIPLVRGWFRQDDFPLNGLLYSNGALPKAKVLHWLHSQGVEYVVLSNATPDFSSIWEERAINSGELGLIPVWHDTHLRIFKVPDARQIVTGPAVSRITSLGVSSLKISLGAPGRYRLAVHYDPYWSISQGCVSRGSSGMTAITVKHPGAIVLSQKITPSRMWDTFIHFPHSSSKRCSVAVANGASIKGHGA